jgi:hypothetical protein
MNMKEEKEMKTTKDFQAVIYYVGGMAAIAGHMALMGWMIVSL